MNIRNDRPTSSNYERRQHPIPPVLIGRAVRCALIRPQEHKPGKNEAHRQNRQRLVPSRRRRRCGSWCSCVIAFPIGKACLHGWVEKSNFTQSTASHTRTRGGFLVLVSTRGRIERPRHHWGTGGPQLQRGRPARATVALQMSTKRARLDRPHLARVPGRSTQSVYILQQRCGSLASFKRAFNF